MRYAESCCKYTEVYSPEHRYIFTGPCICCKKTISVSIAAPGLYAYRQGAYIQEALSNNADEREFLMSGICGPCFDSTMSEDESTLDEDAMEECDGCGEFMFECTCHEDDTYDGDV